MRTTAPVNHRSGRSGGTAGQPRRPGNRVGAGTYMLLCAVLASVGLLAGYLLPRGQVTPPALVSSTTAGTMSAQPTTFDDSRSVTLTVSTGASARIASLVAGTVTASSCVPGGTAASGGSIVSIDANPQLMLYTDTPLWRDLPSGTSGDDARALNAELRRLGADAPDGEVVTWWTLAAFDQIARAVGVTGDLAVAKGGITRDMVLWLPHASVTVSQCGASVGQQVAQGDTLLTASGDVTAATPASPPSDLVAGPRVILIGSEQFDVNADGTGFDSADLLAAIRSSDEYRSAESQSDGTAGGADATDASALSVVYTWQLNTPVDVFAVPPSAIYDEQDASACVVSDGAPTPVEVVASRLGRTLVTAADGLGRIDVAPQEPQSCR